MQTKPVPSPGKLRGSALFLLAMAAIYAYGNYWWKGDYLNLAISGNKATALGVVVNVSESKGRLSPHYKALIEYTDFNQTRRMFKADAGKNAPYLQPGDSVDIVYEIRSDKVIAASERDMMTVYFIFGLAAFLVFGLCMAALQCWFQASQIEKARWSKRVS